MGIVAFVYWPGAQSVARNLIIREAMLMFHTGFPVFDHERLSTSLLLRPFSTYIIIITSIIIIIIIKLSRHDPSSPSLRPLFLVSVCRISIDSRVSKESQRYMEKYGSPQGCCGSMPANLR